MEGYDPALDRHVPVPWYVLMRIEKLAVILAGGTQPLCAALRLAGRSARPQARG